MDPITPGPGAGKPPAAARLPVAPPRPEVAPVEVVRRIDVAELVADAVNQAVDPGLPVDLEYLVVPPTGNHADVAKPDGRWQASATQPRATGGRASGRSRLA